MSTNTGFDPNSAASADSGVFGLPYGENESTLVFLPVPWEATTSYGGGTSQGPQAILAASRQVDLFDLDVLKPYEAGMFFLPESDKILKLNEKAKLLKSDPRAMNEAGAELNRFVHEETRRLLANGKIVGLVGGDHSTPFGALQAIAEKNQSFGILHFDAHSDTREAFEDFTWSHASILFNVLENIPQVKKLVQVGIRDVCEQEVEYIHGQGERVKTYFDLDLAKWKFSGASWAKICEEIVSQLPNDVWVSFDIDGLDPRFCPHTGTPVPGGLDFNEANFLLATVVRSGRRIIGFDLNEVAPDPTGQSEWDANVGARLLYKLSAWTLASQGKAKLNSFRA